MRCVYEALNENTALQYAAEDLNVSASALKICKKKYHNKKGTVAIVVRVESKIEKMIIDFIEHVLGYMKCPIAGDFQASREDGRIWIDINVDDPALIIGYKGRTLDSLQALANVYVGRLTDQNVRVILDIEQYRERRMMQIKRSVKNAIHDIRSHESSVLLNPMNSFERRTVHDLVQDTNGVMSKSEGSGNDRAVRIYQIEENE